MNSLIPPLASAQSPVLVLCPPPSSIVLCHQGDNILIPVHPSQQLSTHRRMWNKDRQQIGTYSKEGLVDYRYLLFEARLGTGTKIMFSLSLSLLPFARRASAAHAKLRVLAISLYPFVILTWQCAQRVFGSVFAQLPRHSHMFLCCVCKIVPVLWQAVCLWS